MIRAINLKNLLISIGISVGTGLLSAVLSGGGMRESYMEYIKPPLSPPAWVFPVVWTILFVLMGISAYLIFESNAPQQDKEKALSIYGFQLFFNFLWSIVFFNLNNYLLAFGVLLILWGLIIAMIINFNKIDETAAKLQIPYLLWVTFAGYLNLAIYLLNG